MKLNSKGVAHLIAILGVVVIGVVGFAGYYVVTFNKETSDKTADQSVPAKIESKSDLEQASKALDADQSDNELDPGQLDDDLNDLL